MIRPIHFDPDRVARLETASWRAYYDRRWLSMARVLVAAHREQFGLSAIDALLATISASRAAVAFARLHAALFDSTPKMMRPSAEWRALAAVAVDRISGGYSADIAADWAQVENHLQQRIERLPPSSTPRRRRIWR